MELLNKMQKHYTVIFNLTITIYIATSTSYMTALGTDKIYRFSSTIVQLIQNSFFDNKIYILTLLAYKALLKNSWIILVYLY